MKLVLVDIENFQRHQRLTLEPHDGLTAVVGSSDAGKSAVIRAIRWALLNEPTGLQLIRHGTKQCSVRLVFTNPDIEVLRVRASTGGVNHWSIKRDGQQVISLDAVGQGVPDPIRQAFPVDVWKEFGSAGQLNFGLQKSTPFLVGHTAGERASILEGISDGILDQAASELNKSARSADSSAEASRKSAETFETQAKEHQQKAQALGLVVDRIAPLVQRADEMVAYANRCGVAAHKKRQCAPLVEVADRFAAKEAAIQKATAFLETARSAQNAAVSIKRAADNRQRSVREVESLAQRIEKDTQQLADMERELTQLQSAHTASICPTCNRPL
jgi:DNA repair protein SbcC/Rad50